MSCFIAVQLSGATGTKSVIILLILSCILFKWSSVKSRLSVHDSNPYTVFLLTFGTVYQFMILIPIQYSNRVRVLHCTCI